MTPNRNRTFLLSAAACGLFFAGTASAQEQTSQQAPRARRAPVAARAPQEGGLIRALPGQAQTTQPVVAAESPLEPEARIMPMIDEPSLETPVNPETAVVDPTAAVEIDMPLGDAPALERPSQSQISPTRGERGQRGQAGQRGRAPAEQAIELPGLEEPSAPLGPDLDAGEELLPPGDLDAAMEAPAQSQLPTTVDIAAPEAKKPGFFRRMWTKIKDGTKKGAGVVKSWFTRNKPETAAPSDAPLTDINLGGGGGDGGAGSGGASD